MVLGHAHETRDILETRGFRSEQTRGVAHFRSERQQQAITCSIMAPQREIKEKEKRTLIFFVKQCKLLDARKEAYLQFTTDQNRSLKWYKNQYSLGHVNWVLFTKKVATN